MRGVSVVAVLACILNALRNGQRPFTYEFHKRVVQAQGLYAFWLGGKCLYVGKSINISQRIYQHRMQEHSTTLERYFKAYPSDIQVSYCSLTNHTGEDVLALEKATIQSLRPAVNITHNLS